MNTKTLFSSAKKDWETPPALFDQLWHEYGPFDLDPCCLPDQYTAQRVLRAGGRIFLPPDWEPDRDWGLDREGREAIAADGLTQRWNGRVYMNPPYGQAIRHWVEMAWAETYAGNAEIVVALLPSRTDTRWWQTYIMDGAQRLPAHSFHGQAAEVRFIRGRLTFVVAENAAPFPSVIVVWRKP